MVGDAMMGTSERVALTVFSGRAADRNSRAMRGAPVLGAALGRALDLDVVSIGTPGAAAAGDWRSELEAARPDFERLGHRHDGVLGSGGVPVTVLPRCAAALATLPVVAAHRPDAVIVWFDAHADSNVPGSTSTGYLGGMVLTGAAGIWPTGLGAGLDLSRVVLAGARDFDPFEIELIARHGITLVSPVADFSKRLSDVVAGRPVYVHLDCDVLEPGLVQTEYRVPGGLALMDLKQAFEALARSSLVGLEIAEFELAAGGEATADLIVSAVAPVLAALMR